MNAVVKFFHDKNELSLLKVMVAISVVLHLVAVGVMSRYGLAKPGKRIVTIKMVQQQKEEVTRTGNKGKGTAAGGGESAEPAQAAKPSQAAKPQGEPSQAARTEAIRRAVSKKGLLSVMGKGDVLSSSKISTTGIEGALARVGEGRPGGTGGSGGFGFGTGTGTDDWAGMGVDTGGFAAAEGEKVAKAAPRVTNLEKSKDLKVESADEAKTADLSNREALEIIKRTVESYLGGLRYSYNKQLRKNPDLQGRVTVAITVTPKGQVERAVVTETTMNNQEMEQEILAKIKHWTFPPVLSKTLTVTYPFVFFPPT